MIIKPSPTARAQKQLSCIAPFNCL